MTLAHQDVGKDVAFPRILGDSHDLDFPIVDSNPSNWISSTVGIFAMFSTDPKTEVTPAVITKSLGAGVTLSPIVDGFNVNVLIDPDDQDDLTPGIYFYAIRLTAQNGRKETVAMGEFELTQGGIP